MMIFTIFVLYHISLVESLGHGEKCNTGNDLCERPNLYCSQFLNECLTDSAEYLKNNVQYDYKVLYYQKYHNDIGRSLWVPYGGSGEYCTAGLLCGNGMFCRMDEQMKGTCANQLSKYSTCNPLEDKPCMSSSNQQVFCHPSAKICTSTCQSNKCSEDNEYCDTEHNACRPRLPAGYFCDPLMENVCSKGLYCPKSSPNNSPHCSHQRSQYSACKLDEPNMCLNDLICHDEKLHCARECSNDSNCSNGEICSSSMKNPKKVCRTKREAGQFCEVKHSNPCVTGYYCHKGSANDGLFGICTARLLEFQKCDPNEVSQCGGQMTCSLDSKSQNVCLKSCDAFNSCSEGQYCEQQSKKCNLKLDVSETCKTNEQCKEGYCKKGICSLKNDGKKCESSTDCDAGQSCLNGKCRRTCNSKDDCALDETCKAQYAKNSWSYYYSTSTRFCSRIGDAKSDEKCEPKHYECETGYKCSNDGYCKPSCSSSCMSSSLSCVEQDEGKVCLPFAKIGEKCDSAKCEDKHYCHKTQSLPSICLPQLELGMTCNAKQSNQCMQSSSTVVCSDQLKKCVQKCFSDSDCPSLTHYCSKNFFGKGTCEPFLKEGAYCGHSKNACGPHLECQNSYCRVKNSAKGVNDSAKGVNDSAKGVNNSAKATEFRDQYYLTASLSAIFGIILFFMFIRCYRKRKPSSNTNVVSPLDTAGQVHEEFEAPPPYDFIEDSNFDLQHAYYGNQYVEPEMVVFEDVDSPMQDTSQPVSNVEMDHETAINREVYEENSEPLNTLDSVTISNEHQSNTESAQMPSQVYRNSEFEENT